MYFKNSSKLLGKNFSQAFRDLLDPTENLKIFTKDGNVSFASRDLVRFFCPLLNSILKDVPCCSNSMVFIPDICKDSVDRVISIISTGNTNFKTMSINQFQEVQETAMMLGMDLTNMEYVEKSKVDVPDCSEASKGEIPAALERNDENELIPQFKSERSEFNDEALLKADFAAIERPLMIKEEPFDDNVDLSLPAEKLQKEYPALSHQTRPSEPESESSKSSSRFSPKHKQYLHKVEVSSRGTKRSISEETMAALAKMIKDNRRKPTIEEMEELLSHARNFTDPIGKPVEIKRSSPRFSERRSERSKIILSHKSRARAADKRSVSSERRPSPYVAAVYPSSAHFQYMQAQHGQPEYQNHPQIPQQGQVQPQIQYMQYVQQGGAVQAFVQGAVPMQYPYTAVQGMEYVQSNLVPPSSVQLQLRSPSPLHRTSTTESASSGDLSRFDAQGVRKSSRSMAEKRASLLTMTVEEKRLMTCKDWNSGSCPRFDSGKLCLYGGSKKKHICSKIIKASKLLGSKVCWGQHREGEHKDIKERVDFRQRERRREDSRECRR